MSEWLTDEFIDKSMAERKRRGQVGMIITEDKKGQMLGWRLRYNPPP